MTSQPGASRPAVSLRGRSAAVRLDGDALLFEQNGVLSRIPLEAVETVRVGGSDRHSVEVVLTSADDFPGPTYRLRVRNSEASVAAFVDVVEGAVRRIRARVPPGDGQEAVQILSVSRSRRLPPGLIVTLPFILLYLTVLIVLVLKREEDSALGWGLSPLPLIGGALLLGMVLWEVYERWILRRRGITVIATFLRHSATETDDKDEPAKVFGFTDLEGRTREITISDSGVKVISGDAERIEITYDPLNRDIAHPSQTFGHLILSIVLAALGIWALCLGLWLSFGALSQLL